jgi:hypothetical protein
VLLVALNRIVRKRFTVLINPIIEVSLQREAKGDKQNSTLGEEEKHRRKNKKSSQSQCYSGLNLSVEWGCQFVHGNRNAGPVPLRRL